MMLLMMFSALTFTGTSRGLTVNLFALNILFDGHLLMNCCASETDVTYGSNQVRYTKHMNKLYILN